MNVIEIAEKSGFDTMNNKVYVFAGQNCITGELNTFAKLVRDAVLEEAAQKCEYVGPQGSALSVINSAFAHEIRNLKDAA